MNSVSRYVYLGSVVALVGIILLGSVAVPTIGASTTTITVDGPASITVDDSAQADLSATDVASNDDIGSYEINLTYDSNLVSVSAGGTDTFDVSTSNSGNTLTVVGYTGQNETAGGELGLADLTIAAEESGTADVEIVVESISDTDGNQIPVSTENITVDIQAQTTTTTEEDGGGGGGGGGIVTTTTTTEEPTETTETTTETTTTTTETTTSTTTTSTQTTTSTTTTSTQTTTTTEQTTTTTTEPTTTETTTGLVPGFGFGVGGIGLVAALLLALRRR